MFLWEIGETVRNMLASRPNVFQIPANGLEIFVVRGFLTE